MRNLTAQEIVGQILLARDRIGDWALPNAGTDVRTSSTTNRKITNIVLMGMGKGIADLQGYLPCPLR